MEYAQHGDFLIGSWRVRPSLNQVVKNAKVVRLAPKEMHVLVCLAEQPGEVFTRAQLLDRVWPDVTVVEEVLTRAIYKLRKTLEDTPQAPQIIETIPKTGYRLIARVSYLSGDAAAHPADLVLEVLPPRPPATRSRLRPWAWGIGLSVATLFLGLALGGHLAQQPSAARLSLPQTLPLTTYPGEELDPALSPDGRYVAFSRLRTLEDSVDLYIKDIDLGTLRRVTADPASDRSPAWSPDGKHLAFMRQSAQQTSLYMVAASGGLVQKLTDLDCHCTPSLAWSPDGQWLAYADPAPSDTARSLFLFSLHTRQKQQLTTPPAGYGDGHPKFSPDGRMLAFAREHKGMAALYLLDLETRKARRLTTASFFSQGLDWTPDGKHILFVSQGNLWRVPIAGGSPAWIATSGMYITQPTVAHQAKRLVYTQTVFDTNIWRASLAPAPDGSSSVTRLVASTRIDRAPQFSPDGQRIAFMSDRGGHCEIWISARDGTNAIRVAAVKSSCMSTTVPRWSPDGGALVFTGYLEGNGDLYIVSSEGGLLRQLTDTPSEEVVPSWSSDGQWIYFASHRDGQWQIWKIPAAGGQVGQVTSAGGYVALESSDGAYLYYTKPGQAGLWRQPTTGHAEEHVLPSLRPDDATNWRIVDHEIYYVNRTPSSGSVIERFDVITRTTREVVALPASFVSCSQMDISPDKQWILYVVADYVGSDLMLVEHIN